MNVRLFTECLNGPDDEQRQMLHVLIKRMLLESDPEKLTMFAEQIRRIRRLGARTMRQGSMSVRIPLLNHAKRWIVGAMAACTGRSIMASNKLRQNVWTLQITYAVPAARGSIYVRITGFAGVYLTAIMGASSAGGHSATIHRFA